MVLVFPLPAHALYSVIVLDSVSFTARYKSLEKGATPSTVERRRALTAGF
jgi:hypothetical protein